MADPESNFHADASRTSLPFFADIADSKLAVAKSIGVDHTVNVKGLTLEQVAKKVEECLGGQPDISIECSGQETCLQSAVYVCEELIMICFARFPTAPPGA